MVVFRKPVHFKAAYTTNSTWIFHSSKLHQMSMGRCLLILNSISVIQWYGTSSTFIFFVFYNHSIALQVLNKYGVVLWIHAGAQRIKALAVAVVRWRCSWSENQSCNCIVSRDLIWKVRIFFICVCRKVKCSQMAVQLLLLFWKKTTWTNQQSSATSAGDY